MPEQERYLQRVKLTPMMQQYMAAKEQYPDAIVMFRLGDFYEMFFDDAKLCSKVLGLTLTSRDKDKEDGTPMAGVPHHSAKAYIARLCDEGYKVAICEQIEDPAKKGMFRREVSRVVTPGMVFDDESLKTKSENILAAISLGDAFGLATLDASTGRFRATETNDLSLLIDEVLRVAPRELVVPAKDPRMKAMLARLSKTRVVDRSEANAAEACLALLREALPTAPKHVSEPERYALTDTMRIDETSRRNLELTQTLIGAKREGSLLHHIDRTDTGMGARLLCQWLTAPSRSRDTIQERQAVIGHFADRPALREQLSAALSQMYDLERLNGRLGALQATPRDLASLRDSLALLPVLKSTLLGIDAAEALPVEGLAPPRLQTLARAIGDYSASHALLVRALADTPPVSPKEGGIFRAGYDSHIDELVKLSESGKDYLLQIETRERERTRIPSLKVRYNRVFGYAIEITKAYLERVPADYKRKQTLANAERFVTPELQEYEEKVLGADEKRLALEETRFLELRALLLEQCAALKNTAQALAEIDALLSLAAVAADEDWVRPELIETSETLLEGARHPVVQAYVGHGYVPCNVQLSDGQRLLIVTGPNMAGKSTVLRKVALCQVLAQMGSYVPAKKAHLSLCDRVFTRVGASDNLSQGQSTFMVEMSETAAILQDATRDSLVIVDEIGRGTSTFDGLSLAWSVAEYLHDVVQCRGLFATHYHELVELERECPQVRNFHMSVKELRGEVVFLRELKAGGTSRSYGIEVAKLAGLPRRVIERARELLAELERERKASQPQQLELFLPSNQNALALQARLRSIDIDRLTPVDALNLLSTLVKQALA